MDTKLSSPVKTRKVITQCGSRSQGFWREYTIDLIMTLNETEEWDDNDLQDDQNKDE